MSSIKLTVYSNDIFCCDFVLDRRISIIRGDSGQGKTTFVDAITERILPVFTTYPTTLLRDDNWQNEMKTQKNRILIVDDSEFCATATFARLIKEHCIENNLWYVIIARDNLSFEPNSIASLGCLSYSVSSVYEFKTKGINHWLEPFFDIEKVDYSSIRCIVTEDTNQGFSFFEKHFNNLEVLSSSSGKSTLVKDVLSATNPTLVIADLAAFGCHMDAFVDAQTINKNIVLLPEFECFE